MKIGTAEIMGSIDKYCIENLGIPSIVLMENAALKVVKNIELDKYSSFTIICGKGNNGGDGFAAARHLHVQGKTVDVFLVGSDDNMSNDCKVNYSILKSMGIKINRVNNVEDINDLRDIINKNDVTIDAIFGTGLRKNVEGIYDTVISVINENSKFILSIDVPSGFDSNGGRILGNCIKANKTISFQLYKKGFLNYGADKYVGQVVIEDIGIPEFVVNKFHDKEFIMDKLMIEKSLVVRDKYSHKGDYGRVLVIAGSKGFTGAAYLTTEGSVRSGAGLVTLCTHEDIVNVLSSKLIEAMTITYGDGERLNDLLEKSDSIAIGPGMGDNDTTYELVSSVIKHAKCPVVIDADGINVLKNNVALLKEKNGPVLITPHLGEMSRLTGQSIEYIKENRIEVAKKFAKDYGVIVLLKGYNTVITDGDMLIINPTGNSSMASGGMGDCLTGMIAAFLGQGYRPMNAACLATYVHGYCGEELSKEMFCVNASHLLEYIPFVIKKLQNR